MIKTIFLFTLPLIAFTYKNIALKKSTWQLHPYADETLRYSANASKAVDGLKTDLSYTGHQCTVSANKKREAEWRVDLGAVLGINHITIYYRTDNISWGPTQGYVPRFLGFSVYISNTTDKEDGVLCFMDNQNFTKENIPAVITLNCPHHGRYVIYYNNRTSSRPPPGYSRYAYNGLCEFEVYGCPLNYFGPTCSQSGPAQCNNSNCHIDTGECFGCKDGYRGPKCGEECENNMYGAGCSEECGHCVNGEQCNPVHGTCRNGCEAGYYKKRCKRVCPQELYGRNCLKNCSEGCFSKTCDGKTGVCEGGCSRGWKLPLCNEECDDSTYGSNCSYSCGHCQDEVPCDKKTGKCPSGCASGYEGIYCNKSKLQEYSAN
ncbi:uncharacterized protein [Magallana gigas]|uniref:uncharacterized protein n=1 Tax=Magallana gigas TaxID=29159 RepID=UPI0033400E00